MSFFPNEVRVDDLLHLKKLMKLRLTSKKVDWFWSVIGMLQFLDTSQDLWRLRCKQSKSQQVLPF